MVSTSPDKRVRRRKRSLQNPKLPFSQQIENIGKPQKAGYFGKCMAEREGFSAMRGACPLVTYTWKSVRPYSENPETGFKRGGFHWVWARLAEQFT
jgi:hypothetical protein